MVWFLAVYLVGVFFLLYWFCENHMKEILFSHSFRKVKEKLLLYFFLSCYFCSVLAVCLFPRQSFCEFIFIAVQIITCWTNPKFSPCAPFSALQFLTVIFLLLLVAFLVHCTGISSQLLSLHSMHVCSSGTSRTPPTSTVLSPAQNAIYEGSSCNSLCIVLAFLFLLCKMIPFFFFFFSLIITEIFG